MDQNLAYETGNITNHPWQLLFVTFITIIIMLIIQLIGGEQDPVL